MMEEYQTSFAQFASSVLALALLAAFTAALVRHALYQLGLRAAVNSFVVARWLDASNVLPSAPFLWILSPLLHQQYRNLLSKRAGIRLPREAIALPYSQLCAQYSDALHAQADGKLKPSSIMRLVVTEPGEIDELTSNINYRMEQVRYQHPESARDFDANAAAQLELGSWIDRAIDRLQSRMLTTWSFVSYLTSGIAAVLIVLTLRAASPRPEATLDDFSAAMIGVLVVFAALAAPPLQRMLERWTDGA